MPSTRAPCAGLGLNLDAPPDESLDNVLRGVDIAEKIALITDQARSQLLAEMTDPKVRVWLIFLELYGKDADRLLSYTMNDHSGVAFKAPRIVRTRWDYLNEIADDKNDPLEHADFEPLRAFVEDRPAVYTDLEQALTRRYRPRALKLQHVLGQVHDGAEHCVRCQ